MANYILEAGGNWAQSIADQGGLGGGSGGSSLPVLASTTASSGTLTLNKIQLLAPTATASWALGVGTTDGDRIGAKNLSGSTGPGNVGVVVNLTGNINGVAGATLALRYADQAKTLTWMASAGTWIPTNGDLSVPSLPFDAYGAAAAITATGIGAATSAALAAEITRATGIEAGKQAVISDASNWAANGNSGAGYNTGNQVTFAGSYLFVSLINGNLATPSVVNGIPATDGNWRYAGPSSYFNATDVGYDLILLIGQSNMSGRGLEFSQALFDPVNERIKQFGDSGTYVGVISPAVEPLEMHDVPTGQGPGLLFARQYVQAIPTNRNVLLVPCAHGGTSFEGASLTWKVGGNSVGGNGAGSANNLYSNAVSQVAAALAAAGPNARLVAVLWHQGESDGDNGTSGTTYQADLDTLITSLRAAIGTVPFIVGQMSPNGTAALSSARSPIDAVHIDTPRRQLQSGFGYGPVAALGVYDYGSSNAQHYDSAGQRLLAASMFAAYKRSLLNVLNTAPVAPPAAPTLVQAGSTTVNVTWTQPSCRYTDFVCEQSVDGGTTWTTVTRTTPNVAVTATLTGLTAGVTVKVRVRTVNEQATSAPSAVTTLTLVAPPAQVTGLAAGTPTASAVPLSWTAVSGATTYLVEEQQGSGAWLSAGTPTGTSYTVTGLTGSTAYNFRVSAQNSGNTGTPSTTVSATTGVAPTVLTVNGTVDRAYGLRQIVSNYTGTIITVRRSSDSTTANIGLSGTDLDTTTLSSFVGSGTGYITQLWDQSGNGHHVSNTTTTAQPIIVNAGTLVKQANNKPGVTFDGSAAVLYGSDPSLYGAGTTSLCAVLKATTARTAASTAARWWAESISTQAGGQYGLIEPDPYGTLAAGQSAGAVISAAATSGTNGVTAAGTKAIWDAAVHQASAVDTGSTISQWIDATADISAVAYSTRPGFAQDRFAIGGVVRNGSLAGLAMMWSEAVFFARALSTADRQTIEANQKAYWGTP